MRVPWYLMAKGKGGGGYKTASGPIVSVSDALAAPLRSLLVNIDPVQDLHGYDNPWPAGGGKNKFDGTFLQGYWAYADGQWTNSHVWITTEKIPCKPSTYYTVSAANKMTRWQGFVWYDENGDYISTTNQQANQNIGYTAESPETAAYMAYNIAGYPNTSSTISPSDVSQFQIEEGQNATPYAPYSNICPISGWTECNVWVKPTYDPTEDPTATIQLGQTVYGGTLDVTNGVLTVDRAMVDLTVGMSGGTAGSGYVFYKEISNPKIVPNSQIAPIISETYIPIRFNGVSGNVNTIAVRDNGVVYVNTGSADIQPIGKAVYTLATPITIPLTPQEISTLQGENNLWADSGDVTVEYLSAGGANPDLMKLAVAFMGRK